MIFVRPKFITGLAAFLWQTALSLDRLPSDDLRLLKEYYESKSPTNHRQLLSRLDDLIGGDNEAAGFSPRFDGSSMLEPVITMRAFLISWFFSSVFGSVPIAAHRLASVRSAIRRLDDLLSNPRNWEKVQVTNIRLELGYAASFLTNMVHPKSARQD